MSKLESTLQVDVKELASLTKQLLQGIHKMCVGQHEEETKELMQQILKREDLLHQHLTQLLRHQKLQRQLEETARVVASKETIINTLATKLTTLKNKLQEATLSGKKQVEVATKAVKRPVDMDTVISYAQKVSYNTSAPPKWEPSKPLFPFRPPYPQEEQMRASSLYTPIPEIESFLPSKDVTRLKADWVAETSTPASMSTTASALSSSLPTRKRKPEELDFMEEEEEPAAEEAQALAQEAKQESEEDEEEDDIEWE